LNETAKFVKYIVHSNLHDSEWEEQIEIPYNEDVNQFIKEMIDRWNKEEKSRVCWQKEGF